MKILVTGGAGFIGSHIADALIEKKHEVRILDDLSSGKTENIAHLEEKVELIQGTVSDRAVVEKAVTDADYIFHEAAQVSVVDSIRNPARTWDTNIRGTKLLLNAAVKNEVKKIIIASSANIYGDDPTIPKKESMSPKPNSPYGESKLMDEMMARKYHDDDGLKVVCLRYFNVYGPRQSPQSEYSGVISKFATRMLKGERPVIYGDGKQTRDFIYVKDVVEANLLAMKKAVGFGVYNIATGKETSLNELVATINEILGTKIEAAFEAERPGDIKRSVADITKAKKEFGFKPKYDLKKGLEETIEWYKSAEKGAKRLLSSSYF